MGQIDNENGQGDAKWGTFRTVAPAMHLQWGGNEMKRLLLMSTVLMAMLMLPPLASATHFAHLDASSDCDGFSADVEIFFRSSAEFLDLYYDVAVLDGDNAEVLMVSGEIHLLNEGGPNPTLVVSDLFNFVLDGSYVVSGTLNLVSPYPGGLDDVSMSFEDNIDCGSVDEEAVTFQQMKAMYR